MKKNNLNRDKEVEVEISLNLSETVSLFEILCTYIHEETEHYWEHEDELNGQPHMVHHFVNLVNGLTPNLKKKVLGMVNSDFKKIKLPNGWKENLVGELSQF